MEPPTSIAWTGFLRVGLGLVALLSPAAAVTFLEEPLDVPFDHPERIAYYQRTIVLLGAGLASGVAAIVVGKAAPPAVARRAGLLLGVAGGAASLFLLLTMMALCGATVLWGRCTP